MSNRPEVSLIIPIYNGADTLSDLIKRAINALESLAESFEIILVDDDSNRQTKDALQKIQNKHSFIQVHTLPTNRGMVHATMFGITKAHGNWLATIDDDLQYDPADLHLLKAVLKGEKRLVFGVPKQRMHGRIHGVLAQLGAFVFHRIYFRKYAEVVFFSTFRLMHASVFKSEDGIRNLFHIWEIDPTSMTHVEVSHQARMKGKSGHNFYRLLRHYRPFLLRMMRQTALVLIFIASLFSFYFFLSGGTTTADYHALLAGMPFERARNSLFLFAGTVLSIFLMIFLISDWLIDAKSRFKFEQISEE